MDIFLIRLLQFMLAIGLLVLLHESWHRQMGWQSL